MSNNRVLITRKLLIKSPLHLYTLIKDQESLLEKNMVFNLFIFSVLRYLEGCKCDEEINKKYVETEYQVIKTQPEIQNLISIHLKCSEVIFTDDENW